MHFEIFNERVIFQCNNVYLYQKLFVNFHKLIKFIELRKIQFFYLLLLKIILKLKY